MHAPFTSLLFILVLLLSSFSFASAKSKRQKADQMWKARKRDCERSVYLCGGMIEEERGNCVAKCISDECWNDVYSHDPIEDGEIDTERTRTFTACTRRVYRENKKKADKARTEERKAKRKGEAAKEEEEEEAVEESSEEAADDGNS